LIIRLEAEQDNHLKTQIGKRKGSF